MTAPVRSFGVSPGSDRDAERRIARVLEHRCRRIHAEQYRHGDRTLYPAASLRSISVPVNPVCNPVHQLRRRIAADRDPGAGLNRKIPRQSGRSSYEA